MQKESVERRTRSEHATILAALAARDPEAIRLVNVEETPMPPRGPASTLLFTGIIVAANG